MPKRIDIIQANEQEKVPLTVKLKCAVKKALRTAVKYEGIDFPCEISLT